MLTKFLYKLIEIITIIHNYILTLNDAFEYNFTDKELHFLIIGLFGMGLVFIVHPIFRYLVKKNHIMTITFIFVFSQIIVVTFAIEIGQKVTNTGNMELKDILFGIAGFLIMFAVFNVFIYAKKIFKELFKIENTLANSKSELSKKITNK